jgi:pimeloyl-ACP methyl ester carboxylesterase
LVIPAVDEACTGNNPSSETNARKAYARVGDRHLHYRVAGSRRTTRTPALICLHAAPFSGRSFVSLLEQLDHNRQILAPDLPGFGDSDPLSQTPDVAACASAIGLLLDALGLETVDLLGHRLGSAVALELARQRQSQVRRLVLFSAPVFTAEERADFERAVRAVQPSEDGEHIIHSWQAFRVRSLEGWNLAAQFADVLRPQALAAWASDALYRYPLAERLVQVSQPVAIYNPDDEFSSATRRAGPLIKNGFLAELPDWLPGFLDIKAATMATLVRDHLDGAVR